MSTARADELDESSTAVGTCNLAVGVVVSVIVDVGAVASFPGIYMLLSNTPEINLTIDDFKARVRVLACARLSPALRTRFRAWGD